MRVSIPTAPKLAEMQDSHGGEEEAADVEIHGVEEPSPI
jgi:hypothetical protein